MDLRTAARTTAPAASDRHRPTRARWALLAFAAATMVPMLLLAGLALAGTLDGATLEAITPAAMLLPGIAAIAVGAILRPARLWTLLRVRPERGWASALGWSAAALGIVAALGLATAALAVVTGAAVPGQWQHLLGALPVVLAMMLVLALGEELGWRGFAQHLLAPLGAARASIAISAFWALWHVPSMVVWIAEGSMPIGVAATTIASLLLGGLALSGLSLLGGSVLPAVVGHAAMNSLVVFATSSVVVGDAATIGLLGLAPWALAAVVLVLAGSAVAKRR